MVHAHGGTNHLRVETEAQVPTNSPTQLLVDVDVAGVNYLDIYQRNGAVPAPFVAGVEGVGTVADCPDGTLGFAPGTRVGWLSAQGSYADQVAVETAAAVAIPHDITSELAVGLLMQGVTAHYLTQSIVPVGPGMVAVVHAGAGGVGRLLIQILGHFGVTVVATASSTHKRAIAQRAGAAYVSDYDRLAATVDEVTAGVGASVVYDGVGQATFDTSLSVLGVRGTLVSIGAASGQPRPVTVKELASRSLSIIRPSVAHYASGQQLSERAAEVFTWFRDSVIDVQIDRRYHLEQAQQAQNDLTSRSTAGKLVLAVRDDQTP